MEVALTKNVLLLALSILYQLTCATATLIVYLITYSQHHAQSSSTMALITACVMVFLVGAGFQAVQTFWIVKKRAIGQNWRTNSLVLSMV